MITNNIGVSWTNAGLLNHLPSHSLFLHTIPYCYSSIDTPGEDQMMDVLDVLDVTMKEWRRPTKPHVCYSTLSALLAFFRPNVCFYGQMSS